MRHLVQRLLTRARRTGRRVVLVLDRGNPNHRQVAAPRPGTGLALDRSVLAAHAANGNSTAGFWFFQSPVSINADGTFSGVHTDGDLLLVVDFTVGGSTSTPAVYRWSGDDATGSLVKLNPPAGAAYAVVPSAPTAVPWSFVDKQGFTSPQPGEFLQAGVDLTALFGANPPRYVSFLAETRSSTSPTSTLSDFALGSVNNIGQAYTVKPGQYGNTVTVIGTDVGTGAAVSASDANYHFGVVPLLNAAPTPAPAVSQADEVARPSPVAVVSPMELPAAESLFSPASVGVLEVETDRVTE